jgi:hypothetical protein
VAARAIAGVGQEFVQTFHVLRHYELARSFI